MPALKPDKINQRLAHISDELNTALPAEPGGPVDEAHVREAASLVQALQDDVSLVGDLGA